MNTVKVKLSDLNPDPKNTRMHDSNNIEVIKESLTKFGQYRAFVVQTQGMIIRVGNGMYEAMKQLGMTEGYAEIKDLTDEEATALSILDNRSSELAEWDEGMLQDCLNDLPDDLAKITGFSDNELATMIADVGGSGNGDIQDKPEIEFSQELLEEHNYLVLYFDNTLGWMSACEKFGVKTVKAWDSKEGYTRAGTGHVINGEQALRRLN